MKFPVLLLEIVRPLILMYFYPLYIDKCLYYKTVLPILGGLATNYLEDEENEENGES